VTVEKWEGEDAALKELRLRIGPGFPRQPLSLQAIFGGRVYPLALRGDKLVLDGVSVETVANYFSREKLSAVNHFLSPNSKTADGFRTLIPTLAARALEYPDVFSTNISPPKDRAPLQLLIAAPAPASLHVQGKGFEREDGWILYVQDVSKP
jgi:hypothetical protein